MTHAHDADPFEHDTDLPLTQSVNGGNHAVSPEPTVADAWSLLKEAAAPLPEPELDLLDAEAVLEWIDRVNRRLLFREDRRRLAREAMKTLEREFRVAMDVDRLRQKLAHDEAERRARKAGTYWAQRDLRRVAQQPTHVEVDLAAWRAVRINATARGRTLGYEVGRLVVAEVAHPRKPEQFTAPRREAPGRRANVFARVVVTKPVWQEFRALAVARGITVARYAGVLVEYTQSNRPPRRIQR